MTNIFYNKWLDNLEYINTTMRSIRRVQIDCTLLDLCGNNHDIMEKEYNGYVFDKILRNDGLFQFMVFLPELKLSSRMCILSIFMYVVCFCVGCVVVLLYIICIKYIFIFQFFIYI